MFSANWSADKLEKLVGLVIYSHIFFLFLFFQQKSDFIQPIFHQYVPNTSVSDITPQLSDFTPTALVGFF